MPFPACSATSSTTHGAGIDVPLTEEYGTWKTVQPLWLRELSRDAGTLRCPEWGLDGTADENSVFEPNSRPRLRGGAVLGWVRLEGCQAQLLGVRSFSSVAAISSETARRIRCETAESEISSRSASPSWVIPRGISK